MPVHATSPGFTDHMRRTRRGQVGVMDRGLAAVLGAAALLGLVSVYFFHRADSAIDNQVQQVNEINSTVMRMFGSSGKMYEGLTAEIIASSGVMPASWTNTTQTTMVSLYHTNIGLVPTTNPITGIDNSAWQLTLVGIPIQACSAIGTTQFVPRVLMAKVNGTDIVTGGVPSPPDVVVKACRDGAPGNGIIQSMSFTFG